MDLTMDHKHLKLTQEKLIKKVGIQLQTATDREREEFNKLNINYRTHTGILNYLACRTQPDLAPAVSILSSFNHAPGIQHWKQVVHCWKYLAGTIQFGLTLRPNSQDKSRSLQHFTDATWADDLETFPITWNSKKQKSSTLSSTEAELNALSYRVQENQWIKFLVKELWNEKLEPTHFHHIDIKMKMLQEMKKNNEILVTLIPSEEMIADALTKPSNHESLSRLQERCFLVTAHYSSSCGGC
ncbi:hypothetical protein VP01_510g13 [Puccinia sorghi]|uniref:Reverse transcriptase Ty1/copia-type domain-containing protein n=1 Tax=Puccinia sorghi TaxID=27349 RepID=A0A0L6UL61_9BASI|nr:hypothetical protein VP01_510g13 [Puccinia sorghi]